MKKHRKIPTMAQKKAASGPTLRALRAWTALAVAAGGLTALPALAQNFPITPGQRSTAQQVARAGVPLSELAPNAPAEYTVQRGDTLWGISGLFLKSPWRWPELWGMNLDEVRNPHRIYPGQHLVLEKVDGMALLRLRPDGGGADGSGIPTDTIRVSPRIRYDTLADASLPTLAPHLIEPFLAEPIIVNELTLERAPRIVATQDGRVLLSRGDRAYARGATGNPLTEKDANKSEEFRVFRNAQPLRDPITKAVLGYEAQFLGKASLMRSETLRDVQTQSGIETTVVPATIDIVAAKAEMRIGDRLVPEPPRQLLSYVPRAPERPIEGSIVSMYGDAVSNAGQNQVVVINRGTADGIQSGHVLAILKSGALVLDRSQPGERTPMKLPDERNGLLMVFRPFERLSYALVLEITDGVQVGDQVSNPR
jgi:hypothetical protein